MEYYGLPLVRVKRLRDAQVAECRDCGRVFADDSPYWRLGTCVAMHNHKRDDGTWERSGGVRRCTLYAIRKE